MFSQLIERAHITWIDVGLVVVGVVVSLIAFFNDEKFFSLMFGLGSLFLLCSWGINYRKSLRQERQREKDLAGLRGQG